MRIKRFTYFLATLLILLGSIVIFGWIFRNPTMVQIVPGFVGMVFNTALCFILTGLLLFTSNYKSSTQQRIVHIILSSIILIIALLNLSQDIFNYQLGIDRIIDNTWLHDPNPTPGRMAPNTSIGFILIGSLGLLLPYGYSKTIGILIQLFTFLVFIIAVLGLIVYSLKLEFVFTWYSFTRMAVHTAIGFLIASGGFWFTIILKKWFRSFYKKHEDRRIILVTAFILLGISLVMGFGGAAWLIHNNLVTVERSLEESLQTRIEVINRSIANLQKEAAVAAMNPNLVNILSNKNLSHLDYFHALKFYMTKGFAVFQVQDEKGKVIFKQGEFVVNPVLLIALNSQNSAQLFWKEGYWLRLKNEIKSALNAKVQGYLIGEIPLVAMNQVLTHYQNLGSSGDINLCKRLESNSAVCYPSRFSKSVFTTPLVMNGNLLPIGYALSGHKGIVHTMDYRRQNVIAAYNMLNPFPLGIVLKINSSESYQAIGNQLKFFLPIVILFIFMGLILLYWQVLPLVRKVVSSERQAKDAKKNLERSLEALSQRNKEIQILSELGENLQASLELSEAYKLISKYGQMLLPGSTGILYLKDAVHDYLEAVASWGRASISKNIINPQECWALRKGLVHQVEDEKKDVLCRHIALEKNSSLDMICIPLLVQGVMIGLFFVSKNSNSNLKAISNNQFMVAQAFGEQIGIGISNIQLREKLSNQSIHDPLTGLYNRRYMEEALAGELRQVEKQQLSLSIIMFDIDNFKQFNDDFGHDAGDAVLVKVSDLIRQNIRAHDFACRFGGEEFIFILPGTSLDVALNRAQQLLKNVKELRLVHNHILLGQITISIGIATYPKDGNNTLDLIKAADIALYQAKKNGRDQIVVYETINRNSDF